MEATNFSSQLKKDNINFDLVKYSCYEDHKYMEEEVLYCKESFIDKILEKFNETYNLNINKEDIISFIPENDDTTNYDNAIQLLDNAEILTTIPFNYDDDLQEHIMFKEYKGYIFAEVNIDGVSQIIMDKNYFNNLPKYCFCFKEKD